MQSNKRFHLASAVLGAGCLLAASGSAQALAFQFDELDINLETSITAGIAIRGEDADSELISKANLADKAAVPPSARGSYNPNGDDGNLAFRDAGDLFFAQAKLSSDLTIQWGDWGVFARGNYRYDPNIQNEELFDDFDYGPNRSKSNADKRRRENAVEDAAGNDAELFDLYLFGNFKIGDHSASLRIGRQVLNWGEATFIGNGINSIIPIDARQARGPGAEIKEVFRPFGMVYGSVALTENTSIEAFYQFEWQETIPDPAGTYFSTNDVVGAGSAPIISGQGRCNENIPGSFTNPSDMTVTVAAAVGCGNGTNIPFTDSDEPEDGGQYGARFNVFLPWLNSTDLSLYAVNYHSRLPFFGSLGATTPTDSTTARALLVYPEDIELYGLSFNTFLESLGAAFQGEYSYKRDQPLSIDGLEYLLFTAGLPAPLQTVGTATGQGGLGGPGGGLAPGQRGNGFIREDVHQVDFSFLKRYGPNFTGANDTNILFEVGAQYIPDLPDPSVLPIEAPGTDVPNQPAAAMALGLPAQDRDGYADDFAWGYRLVIANTYNGVFNRFNLTPSIRFFHDVHGNSPSGISTFLEDRKQVVLGLSGTYLDAWEAGMSYTFFFGSGDTAASPLTLGESAPAGGTNPFTGSASTNTGRVTSGYSNNLVEDRDFFNLFVRYTF